MRALHTSLVQIYGYAPKGERLRLSVPRTTWGRNPTLCLPAGRSRGDGAVFGCGGGNHRRSLGGLHIREVLLPNLLRAGQIVVMDNLGAHRPKRIGELIERRGCELIYLPAPTPPTTQPHRGGLQQDKGSAAPGRGQEQGGCGGSDGRSDGRGAVGGQCRRRPGLVRARRLPFIGSATVKHAVRSSLPVARPEGGRRRGRCWVVL